MFLDVGGPLFSDASYFTSLFEAIEIRAPHLTRERFDAELAGLRSEQSRGFTEGLLAAFVDGAEHTAVRRQADAAWERIGYRAEDLFPEVFGVLRDLARRYRMAAITNNDSWVRDRAASAGISDWIEHWAISSEIGAEKPDERIFRAALDLAGCRPEVAVMVGDRLDRDLVPAKRLGFRTVWILRNEAPDAPTPEQVAVPDAAIHTLDDLPATLDRIDRLVRD